MTRWLVTGAAGMLGRDLVAALASAGQPVTALTRSDLDVTDRTAVAAAVAEAAPHAVVNCAAWTAVDEAEVHEDEALLVNGQGAANVAGACASSGARLVQISTDYVFAGDAGRPYPEDAAARPHTAYGRSKLAGEQAVLAALPGAAYIVRTAWLFGAHGPNFVRTMIRLERERLVVPVVADQYGQPTWTAQVAAQVNALVQGQAAAGVYHATSSGQTTWFGLAREIFRLLGADPDRVTPTTTAAFPRPAPRPGYSVLGHRAWAAAGIPVIGDWRDGLRQAFPALAALA